MKMRVIIRMLVGVLTLAGFGVSAATAGMTGAAPYVKAATVYDGCIADASSNVSGTIQVKVAKGRTDRKTGEFVAKVTATVQLADGSRKLSFKGGLADASGGVTEMSANGHVLKLTLGDNALTGSFDSSGTVEGGRNLFLSRDPADKSLAAAKLAKWPKVCNIVGNGVVLGVTSATKGKVKVAGTVNGVRVSTTGQISVGVDGALTVPVVIARKVKAAFRLSLSETGEMSVTGLGSGVVSGPAGTLKPGAEFRMDDTVIVQVLSGLYRDYLPVGVSVAQNGVKWVVANGAKAGKVVLDRKTGGVNTAKLGTNPSGLKLTYKAKTGSFKGSFKAYAKVNGRIKSYSFSVTGVLVDGVGYGTAILKKPAITVAITIGEAASDDDPTVDGNGGVQLWKDGPFWAECNVGATKPEECGCYFTWGDTVGYKRNGDSWDAADGSRTGFAFVRENCPTAGKTLAELQAAGYTDAKGDLLMNHDAARAGIGAPWRMPTDAEFAELSRNCDVEWVSRNGAYGGLVKGRGEYSSKSIFLPAGGDAYDTSLQNLGTYGFYWTATAGSDDSSFAWGQYSSSGGFYRNNYLRHLGRPVRPVR